MKKSIYLVVLAVACASALVLSACSVTVTTTTTSTDSSGNTTTTTNTKDLVNGNSSTTSVTTSNNASNGASALESAKQVFQQEGFGKNVLSAIGDEGITSMASAEFQMQYNQVASKSMSYEDIEDFFGCAGSAVTGANVPSNIYAWASSDKKDCFMVLFDGSGDDAKLLYYYLYTAPGNN